MLKWVKDPSAMSGLLEQRQARGYHRLVQESPRTCQHPDRGWHRVLAALLIGQPVAGTPMEGSETEQLEVYETPQPRPADVKGQGQCPGAPWLANHGVPWNRSRVARTELLGTQTGSAADTPSCWLRRRSPTTPEAGRAKSGTLEKACTRTRMRPFPIQCSSCPRMRRVRHSVARYCLRKSLGCRVLSRR